MDIVKCWAHNKAGLRCMQPAGHEGVHAHAIEWTDEECWEPGAPIEVTLKEYGTIKAAPVTEHLTNPLPTRCALCNHGWHEGRCNGMDGDFACDCASGIPE